MDFWLQIQKTSGEIRIIILEMPYVPMFKEKKDNFNFFGKKFAQKWILGLQFQKSKSDFRNSAFVMPRAPISVKTFFDLNLGKLPNHVWYFGSNNVGGVAEGWLETEMSWVDVEMSCMEVGAPSSNTYLLIYFKQDCFNFPLFFMVH